MGSPRTVYFPCVYLYKTKPGFWELYGDFTTPQCQLLQSVHILVPQGGPKPWALLGIPGIGRTQAISNGAPISLPRVHSELSLWALRRSCCPTSGCSLGLGMRHLFSLPWLGRSHCSRPAACSPGFQPGGNSPTGKVLNIKTILLPT